MKIQRSPFKNKTIYKTSKIKLNPKILKKFAFPSLKEINGAKRDKNDKTMIKLENKKLNFIYMVLNKTVKFNNFVKKYFSDYNNDKSSLYDKSIPKKSINKSCILQNLFLANSLNMDKINIKANNNTNNNIIKNINMNKYFLDNINKNGAKSYDDNKLMNSNKKEFIYNSLDSIERNKNLFSLMRIKSNMKYIKQNPFFKDLNLQPSSEKTWLFSIGKNNPISNSHKIIYDENNKKSNRIIPRINLIKNINRSNLINKSKNYNNYLLKEINNRKENRNNSENKNIKDFKDYNSTKTLYKTGIKNDEKIIFGYNFINNKNYKQNREISNNNIIKNIKNHKLIKSNYKKNFNKLINTRNNDNIKNNNYRLNSCRIPNNIPKIIIKNNKRNISNNIKENNKNIDVDILNEDLILSKISFSDEPNENDNFIFLNPIYS